MINQGVFDTMGPTATWEYVGKISPAIPTLRKLVDHMEGTVNSYRRYKKHTVTSTEDDIAKLMVSFQESALYCHVDGRKVIAKEKFVDTWAKGFDIVWKGESLTRWFEGRSEFRLARKNNAAEDHDELTFSELEEMTLEEEDEYAISFHPRYTWEPASDDAPSPSMLSEC
jgi:hypothetical protein